MIMYSTGYGTHDAVGHIDFFPNGGEHQPGCPEKLLQGVSLSDITGIMYDNCTGFLI